ncbi:MAG: hypothetical protein ISS70_19600, partial [Phycisphaerae bacterium]|nr:hypothetical protein [Phycisphaerae bacterium]
MRLTSILLAVLALSIGPLCSASITGVAGGTPAPGATLGPYFMTPFPDEYRTGEVFDVDSPLGGQVFFFRELPSDPPTDPPTYTYSPLSLRINSPSSWTAIEHIYTGKVYFTQLSSPSSMRLTLPSNTVAFYFYATSNHTGDHDISATASGTSADGTSLTPESLTQGTDASHGASYYGFYAGSGESLTTIDLEVVGGPSWCDLNAGFTLGAFGIAIPGYAPPGSDVIVTDPETGTTISFETVTQGGQTTVTTSAPGQTQGPPAGFKLVTTP